MEKRDKSRALGSQEIRERDRILQRGLRGCRHSIGAEPVVSFLEIREISSQRKERSTGSEVAFADSGFTIPSREIGLLGFQGSQFIIRRHHFFFSCKWDP